MSTLRSQTVTALVLKYTRSGEADKIVTLITQPHGKIVTIAKSARKLSSRQGSFLEPGNIIRTQLITTKSLPILAQTELINNCSSIQTSLPKLRQLQQLLETFYVLLVEEELSEQLFELLLTLRREIVKSQPTNKNMLAHFETFFELLGYARLAETQHHSISDYIAELTDKPLKSWRFFSP